MKRKYIYILMQLFTSICVVSVGFASWTFVSGDSIVASGNIKAEDVITDNEIVSINDTNLLLEYYKTGFIDLDENGNKVVSDTGILTITYNINLEKYKEKNPGATNLDIKIYLDCISTYNDFNIFNSTYIECSEDTTTSVEVSKLTSKVMDASSYYINLKLNDITDANLKELIVTVNYKFVISNANHKKFYSDVYPKMDGITFKPSVMVSGD